MAVKLITSKYNDQVLLEFIEGRLVTRYNYIKFNDDIVNNIINKKELTDYIGKTIVVTDYPSNMNTNRVNTKYIKVLTYLLQTKRHTLCSFILIGISKEYWNPQIRKYIDEVYDI